MNPSRRLPLPKRWDSKASDCTVEPSQELKFQSAVVSCPFSTLRCPTSLQAAAAMVVGVGSLSDPANLPVRSARSTMQLTCAGHL